ncbi:MAG: hypothetical protein WAT72_00735 [Microgenomates group bacterium]|jgi:hypothetical protein|nr:MAG: hypothetical protein IPH70_00255 [Candidatus Roizmanbacteria bacterium]
MKNRAPLALLFGLTAVLVFIVGVRYGQHVESTNKQNAYNFSLTPLPQPTTQPKQVKYSMFTHKLCKISFVIPDTLKKIKESSVSAIFEENSNTVLSFTCDKNGSGSAKLNPYTGKQTFFTVDKSLQTLIDNTLTFLK